MTQTLTLRFAIILGLGTGFGFAACTADNADDANDDGGCPAGKCDTPQGEASATCLKREAEVISSSNRGFTPDAIRWACADVEGVTAEGSGNDSRGQEYCEYFAIVQPPGASVGVDLGRPLDGGGKVTKLGVCVPGESGNECRVTLNDDQVATLEDNPTSVVGKCVFTSWHSDITKPVPACPKDSCPEGAGILGIPFTSENYSMKVGFNSNGAAIDLVEKCFPLSGDKLVVPDWTNPDDPAQQPYYRGCMGANLHFGTEWRRSDPSICAGVNRMAECGCSAPGVTNGTELAHAVLPPVGSKDVRRGFRLGTWDNDKGLPSGCKFSDTGETGFLVECDITAADLIANRNDPKEFCRATYGGNVVVHVDIPRAAITCDPPATEAAKTCGEIPWNIGQENAGGGDSGNDSAGDGGSDSAGDGGSDSAGDGGSDSGADGAGDGGAETGADTSAETGGADGGAPSDCCTPHEGGGCSDAAITECVCGMDVFCCDGDWDDACVAEVAEFNCGTC